MRFRPTNDAHTVSEQFDAFLASGDAEMLVDHDALAEVGSTGLTELNAQIARCRLQVEAHRNGFNIVKPRTTQPVEEKAKGEGKAAPAAIVHDTRIYSHERYNQLGAETVAQLEELGRLKGGEYAGDQDRLANFRRNAERLGISMETVWSVYAAKHWDAIMQYVMDLNTGKTRVRLEGLAGRADDIIVYMVLFKAILEERELTPEEHTFIVNKRG